MYKYTIMANKTDTVCIASDNNSCIRSYSRQGYRITGRVKSYARLTDGGIIRIKEKAAEEAPRQGTITHPQHQHYCTPKR